MKSRVRIWPLIILLTAAGIKEIQAQPGKLFKQPAHVFPQKLSWWDSIYQYPQFGPGRITYFTDFAPTQNLRFNYNLYYGQMDMIDAKGDTVRLKPLKTIKTVQLGNDVYFLDQKKGYLFLVIQGDVTLVARRLLHLTNGGSGTDLRGSPSIFDKYYVRSSIFFFMGADGKVATPSKSILLKTFPEFKDLIDDYVQSESINFSSEADLVKITEFCNRLRRITPDSGPEMVVRANERVSLTLREFTYRFPEFQEGVVVYSDGSQKRYSAGLNYNLLTAEMDAIEARDTAKVKNSSSIATVNIDGTAYFKKSEGYIELILNGPVSVGVTRTIYLLHSQSVQVSVKYTPDSGYDPTSARNDVTNFDRKFARQNRYYLIDGSESVYAPTEATLYRLYPSHKKEINAYIAERHPDLKGEEDLKLMISYLSSLKG